ncbi:MMPL family transporter [Actinacidiphila alni]|uniref:MMPL family transporter n=1 Tax=Actinacidiphila alni TaxID=380248 RepID=UPI003406065C
MATFLYRLGRLAFRQRRRVALLWVAVLAAIVVGAMNAGEAPDDSSAMPGTEAQKAFDLIDARFPGGAADGADARVVFIAPGGHKVTEAANRTAIDAFVTDVAAGPQVSAVANPFAGPGVSKDGGTAYATVSYKVSDDDLGEAAKKRLTDAVAHARDAGLTVEAGGSALDSDSGGEAGELLGIVIAAVVLLITFGSLAAAGLPLVTAVVGVTASIAAITALGSALGLPSTTAELAMMLGIAVGIDYALFVVSRYREERGKGHTPQEAAGLAVGTAGSAVVFAGLTVIIALAGLSVVGVPFLTKMGLTAAGTVLTAVLVALTLVPALLGFWPNAVLSRRIRKAEPSPATGGGGGTDAEPGTGASAAAPHAGTSAAAPNAGSRWAGFVQRHPLPVLIATVVGLGALALPMLDLRLGMPGDEAKSTATSERRAYDALAEGFGPGFNGPLTVVVDARQAPDAKAAVSAVAARLGRTDGVVSVSPARFNAAGDTAVLTATPATAPTSGQTRDLVRAIRDQRPATESATRTTFEVTGTTALNIDVAQKMQKALVPYLAVVVGFAFLLLMLVFRSVLVPLKAALGFLLSVLASLGAVVLVFQQGHGAGLFGVDQTGPIMSTMPIFLVGIVFGLAMDYEVFLVSRMREAYVHGERPDQAVVSGFRHSARVVVAAALIMMAVFGGFMTGGGSLVKMVGFGLAGAVLFDAIVVRMAFVPAVMALLGRAAWWLPRPLDRLLPRVDVEGAALDRHPVGVTAPAGEPRQDTQRV